MRVNAALSLLKHRGPDEGNSFTLSNAIIAHRRLSIIDISDSHQPMRDPDKRYYLSYNGEIYNYQQLRKQLEAHWTFTTNGDTEVLLAGLIVYGSNFVEKIEGMWAFVFWDVQEEKLLLSRDRLGKKPLYFYYSDDNPAEFHCASEIPALLRLLEKTPEEDADSRTDYLKYGYFLPGFTIYKNIFEVLPGHNAIFMNGKIIRQQYWQLKPEKRPCKLNDVSELLGEHLDAAINKRLIADVEVGAFLSGGIDSSLIVAFAQKHLDSRLKTFSIGFEEASFDETDYAQQIANRYQTEHQVKFLKEINYEFMRELTEKNLGQPFADSSILPTFLVSQTASKSVKVVLSGDGADELFSGYQRYTSRSILRWYNRLPLVVRKNLEAVIRAIPEPHKHHSASLIKKAHLFTDISNRLDSETPYIAPVFFSNQELQSISPDSSTKGKLILGELEETSLDDISRMMYADALVYLPQDILQKVDRASMATSLETRTPFLDHKLVELAFSIPTHWHRKCLKGKQMLKREFRNLLPDNIWSRRKQGFATPQSMWFKSQLGDSLLELTREVESPLSHNYIQQLLYEHRTNKRDYGGKLWLLYSYLLWKSTLQ